MNPFAKLADLKPLPIWNDVLSRAVQGDHITMAVVELAPDSIVPEHHHPNEQIGIVLKGSLRFTIGGVQRELVVGDTYKIPVNVAHSVVTGPNGAVVVDIFSPLRADWALFEALPPAPPKWP